MNADEYILHVRATNPGIFKANKVLMSPEALEKMLRRAHEVGAQHGREKPNFDNPLGDLWDSFFKPH